METPAFHNLFGRRPITNSKAPATKWFKEWVPQDVIATGGKCFILKWVNEATLKALKEKPKEPEVPEPEPKPATDVLFLCTYEGCGKTFIDVGSLRKHSHIHGERQYVCHYENCGKKFLDSSKLKRHYLIHTGERNYMCPYEGCGKAFSLDFNLKSHMKTHSQDNYHICPFPECGKRYAHEYKLKNHIASAHQKMAIPEAVKQILPAEKPTIKATKSSGAHPSASSDRPYTCPYDSCDKAYIHEYKLNLHLRKEHPGHFPEEGSRNFHTSENKMDEGLGVLDAYPTKRKSSKTQKQSRPKPNLKLPPAKAPRLSPGASPANVVVEKKPWPVQEGDEDSEETEEEKFVGNEDDEDTQ